MNDGDIIHHPASPPVLQARSQPQKSGGAPVTSKGAPNSRGGVVGEVLRIRGGGSPRKVLRIRIRGGGVVGEVYEFEGG